MTSELEAENARLRRQLQFNNVVTAPEPDLPDDVELMKLLGIVEKAWPVLHGAVPAETFRALRWASFARKKPALDANRYITSWLDTARQWSRAQGYSANISLRSFMAAVIASGDIRYSALTRWPYDIEVALALGELSRPASRWRHVLTSGKPLTPTALNRPLLRPVVEHQLLRRAETDDGNDLRRHGSIKVRG